ncbi:CrcB family protein [Billgrantia azerbaijanica]|nr:CrcB family protein [Halomonas azerbaijanica]
MRYCPPCGVPECQGGVTEVVVDWVTLGLVAGGGALGGMGRLAVSNAVARRWGAAFPWGTLAVNLSGALGMGLLAGLLGGPGEAGPAWSLAAVGLLGGYTTVSSLSLQVLTLWQQGRRAATLGYALGTLGAGLVALWLGASLAGGLS